MLHTLIVVTFLGLCCKDSLAYTACKKLKPAENLNSEWFYSTATNGGHYVIATSECQNCEKGDKAWQWLRQRTTPKKFCFRVHGVTPEGYFNIDAFCEFPNPERITGNCALDFTKYETKITMKGSFTIFLTDNENYNVSNFCIFGKENAWYITSPRPHLDPKIKEEVFQKIKEVGFDTNVAVEGVSPVILKNTTLIECK